MAIEMRFSCDTGGTFTDLIVESDDGELRMYKAATTPISPVDGVLDVLRMAADDLDLSLDKFLSQGSAFIHGTTHAINAIITGKTARTAFLTTAGHPDILVIREGGRAHPFDYSKSYPKPYVPRAFTFEVPERIQQDGTIITPLDEGRVHEIIDQLELLEIEAVAVTLLWSTVNPTHERRIGQIMAERLPHVAVTLSHVLNPSIREYRRASSTAIDASLKPLMRRYMRNLIGRLHDNGFTGEIYVLTSQGGMMDASALARAPIHAINSGPSMAPIAGRYFAATDSDCADVIVADTGGTTYDVSLVRRGHIPVSREMWVGEPYVGHMTGFPSVDVKSIGAGGGSIAWVDVGGMLHVGPKSAGSDPGPVCYGRGGTTPTLTDACLVLGFLDPDYFLGGQLKLDLDGARTAVGELGENLCLDIEGAAAAIVDVATENMVQAISNLTVNQGVDPAAAVLIGGGGAAGLNSVKIARRLGCSTLIIPEVGAGLSAAGALMTELSAEYRAVKFMGTDAFDFDASQRLIDDLDLRIRTFANRTQTKRHDISYAVEARYPGQVWEIEIPFNKEWLASKAELAHFNSAFHDMHQRIFGIADEGSEIECVSWIARVRCLDQERNRALGRLRQTAKNQRPVTERNLYFSSDGHVKASVYCLHNLEAGASYDSPAIVESAFTSVIIDPDCTFTLSRNGSLIVDIH
jgi:N-methylhydantoinase A